MIVAYRATSGEDLPVGQCPFRHDPVLLRLELPAEVLECEGAAFRAGFAYGNNCESVGKPA